MSTPSDLLPVSIVIRSYRRIPATCELVAAVLAQRYDRFEIVIVEQTADAPPEEKARLQAFAADPRVRILWSGPLGPSGARNVGWQAARYDLVLFMDDDDLPIGQDWITGHAENYRDPSVVGVSGREVNRVGERCNYGLRWLARAWCMAYDFIGTPHVYARFDERVDDVDWLHGGNASIRKTWIERVGGWDPSFTDHEEHSFCWRLLTARKAGGERLVFDPAPVMLRRKDIGGGLDRRKTNVESTFRRWHRYYHTLVRAHRPVRFWLLYPAYVVVPFFMSVRFVWGDSDAHRSFGARLGQTLLAILRWPLWYATSLAGRHG